MPLALAQTECIQVGVRLRGLDLSQHDHIPVRPRGEAELAPVFLLETCVSLNSVPLPPTPGAPPVRGNRQARASCWLLLLSMCGTDHPLDATVQHRLKRVRLDVGIRAMTDRPYPLAHPDESSTSAGEKARAPVEAPRSKPTCAAASTAHKSL